MTRIVSIVSAIFLVGLQSSASKPGPATIQYVGAISIQPSHDAKVLADWYDRFGIQTQKMDENGKMGYFGMFNTAAGPFFFAIHQHETIAPLKSSGSVTVVFRVDDYDSYLANAAKNKIAPQHIDPPSSEGRYAHFVDPDGNEMTIWGN